MSTKGNSGHPAAGEEREGPKEYSPMVSVIIPCYNYGQFLQETIESVLKQTYQDIEIIVVNDGSTDDTEEICLRYQGQIQYVPRRHEGIVETINAGIKQSRGMFFYFLSADDKLFPETIEKQVDIMRSDKDCAVVCGNAQLINERGDEIGENIIPLPEDHLLLKMLVAPPLHDGSLLFRRSALERVGGLYFKDFESYHGYHHRSFQLARHYRIRYLNDFFVYQRVHDGNLSNPKNLERMIDGYEIIRKKMREILQPLELFEGLNPKSQEDQAKAYFWVAVLFFYFGQYDIAYGDLKKAIDLHRDIWNARDAFPEIEESRYLYPLKPYRPLCRNEGLLNKLERGKGAPAEEILKKLEMGEVLKAFYLCRRGMEDEPQNGDLPFLLGLVYLHQMQCHDSVNRYHKVTRNLLEEVHRNNPFHSIDLYLWLAFLDEGKRHDYLRELEGRIGVLKWFDLNETLWLTENALLTKKKDLVDEIRWVFKRSGLTLKDRTKDGDGKSKSRRKMGKSEKGRVLFINPPYRRFMKLEHTCFPLSFGYMATMLKEEGYDVGIYDADFDKQFVGKTGSYEYTLTHQKLIGQAVKDGRNPVWQEVKQTIDNFRPDVVGITAMTNKYPMAEKVAEIAKSVHEDLRVVIGGYHPSIYGERVIRNQYIDFVVRGEGEMTLIELINQLFASSPDLSTIRGLIYKEGDRVRTNPPRELIQDINLLPIPDRDLILNESYVSSNNLMTSRGCPFHCSYCGARVIWEQKIRRRSIENVIKEIQGLLQKNRSRTISFWDDSFTLDKSYIRELMKRLRGIEGLTFSCITRLDLVDKEILKELKVAGCNHILFGIEFGSERILKSINKGMSRDFIKRRVKEVNSIGIPWLGFFMMGYPGETREDILETWSFMKELDPPSAEINIFNPLPGTRIWDELEEKGLVKGDMDFAKYSQSSSENLFLDTMGEKEFEDLALWMVREFDSHNKERRAKSTIPANPVVPIQTEERRAVEKTDQLGEDLPPAGFTDHLPTQAHFLMIDKCNSKCIMCGGDYFKSQSGRLITPDKFKQMCANLCLERFHGIVLSGAGDPLLNPHLVAMIRYANERYPKVKVMITTNGIGFSEELSRNLLECHLSSINVSLNAASRAVYRRVMQVDCFEIVIQNVRRLITLRNKQGSKPLLQFSSVINRLNIEDLPRLVQLGHEMGIDSIHVMYCRFYPERIRHLNVDSEEDRLKDEDSLYFHQELSDRLLEETISLAQRYGIRFTHEPLFKENANSVGCEWPIREIMVGFDGEVYPCGGAEVHFKDKVERGVYHFGNALTEPIDQFWNGEMYRALRVSSQVENPTLVPECQCCANRVRTNDRKSHIMQWDEVNEKLASTKPIPSGPFPGEKSGAESPLVSIIVPTYNRPERLVETLRSILDQTYPNIEILVVNDSGIGVENIITFLNQKGNITYMRHGQNRGLAAARNTGIRLAKGKYIAYLDDDDLYYPDHLETLVHFLEENKYQVAYSDAYRAHEEKEHGKYVVTQRDLSYSFDFDYDRILKENFIPVLCFMHEKSCLDEVGCFDETLKAHEDWDLWMRMSRKFKFGHIKKITCEFTYRPDHTSMTYGRRDDMMDTFRIVTQRGQKFMEEGLNLEVTKKAFISQSEGDEKFRQETYEGIKRLLINKGKYEEAIYALEKFLDSYPDDGLAHNDLGVLYYNKGEKEKALSQYEEAVSLHPENITFQKNLADFYYIELKRIDEAAHLYKKVLSIHPNELETLLILGNIHVELGKFRDALSFYENVLKIDPGHKEARKSVEILKKQMGLQEREERVKKYDTVSPSGNEGIICLQPFYFMEFSTDGNVYTCCPAWTKVSIGNIKNKSIAEIWNSQEARYVRKKIYQGAWQDICNPICPHISEHVYQNKIFQYSHLAEFDFLSPGLIDEIKAGKEYLDSPPTVFNLSNSTVCNLSCIMCSRTTDGHHLDLVKKTVDDLTAYLPTAKRVVLTGMGDPLARPDSRNLLIHCQSPHLKFDLITNGLLLPTYWAQIKTRNFGKLLLSVDAPEQETYEKIRRGGSWADLLKTLSLIKDNRSKFDSIDLNMTVMRENYEKISAFIDFAESYGFVASFQRIRGSHGNQNIFEDGDSLALSQLREILSKEKGKSRGIQVYWGDLLEFIEKDEGPQSAEVAYTRTDSNARVVKKHVSPSKDPEDFAAKVSEIKRLNFRINAQECKDQAIVMRARPLTAIVSVGQKCNLKCIMCSHTIHKLAGKNLPWSTFTKAQAIFPTLQRLKLIGAGEPFLNEDYFGMLEMTKQYNLGTETVTNGTLITEEVAKKIVISGPDALYISIDGATPETYESIRKGAQFHEVIQNIKRINELKKKYGSKTPVLGFSTVIMKRNIHELPMIIDLAAKLNISSVTILYLTVFSKELIFESLFFHQELSNSTLTEVKERAKRLGLCVDMPELFNRDAIAQKPFSRKKCFEPWQMVLIESGGEVIPCCTYGEVMGNLNECDFMEIWNSENYQNLRRRINSEDPPEPCRHCSNSTVAHHVNDIKAHIKCPTSLEFEREYGDSKTVIYLKQREAGAGALMEATYPRAMDLIQKGKTGEAIQLLEHLILSHPDHALAQNDLGFLYYERGEKEKALAHYEKAVELDPKNITSLKNLGDFYYVELGRTEDALKIYHQILTTHPDDVEALFAFGNICTSLNRIDDALSFYQKILQIDPDHREAKLLIEEIFKKIRLDQGQGPKGAPEPWVSIILSVNHDPRSLQSSIGTVLQNTEYPNFELILVSEGLSRDIEDFVASLGNKSIKQFIPPENIQKIAGLNLTARSATGDYLVFMDRRSLLSRDWLSPLLKVASDSHNFGSVAPKVIAPPVSMIEAGFSFSDGIEIKSAGEGGAIDCPKYNYFRETPSGSRYLMLVSREAFVESGGFDENITDFGLAMIDLGMTLRGNGKAVCYQPSCIVGLKKEQNGDTADQGAVLLDERKIKSLRPSIVKSVSGLLDVGATSRKKVLVFGIYLADKLNNVDDIIQIFSSAKDYDVTQRWVGLGGNTPTGRVAEVTVRTLMEKRPKYQIMNELIVEEDITQYEYVIMTDDDVVLPIGFVDTFLALQEEMGFVIAQPARTSNSYIDHPIVEQHRGILARETRFVEIGPVVSFHQSVYDFIFPFDLTSSMGWGYENVWSYRVKERKMKMGIIDHIPVDHSLRKPVENYDWCKVNQERQEYLARHDHLPIEECFTTLNVINYRGVRE